MHQNRELGGGYDDLCEATTQLSGVETLPGCSSPVLGSSSGSSAGESAPEPSAGGGIGEALRSERTWPMTAPFPTCDWVSSSMRLLLISNSIGPDGGYLDHCADEMVDFAGRGARVLFVPFAGIDEPAYAAVALERLANMGFVASSADRAADPVAALGEAEAVFVGGGNTFLLLDRLVATGMLGAIRERALAGMPYMGASAGSNVAGPTIRTTNDMPIVEPPSFSSIGLVPFQINPHYVDRDPDSSHRGETRHERLQEYLSQNVVPVVALREGAMLRVEGASVMVRGTSSVRVYQPGATVEEVAAPARLDELFGMSFQP